VDHSVKVNYISYQICDPDETNLQLWDLSSGTLLTTFQFPHAITHLAWDVTERVFFAASQDGSIHCVSLFRQRKTDAGESISEAVGGGGTSEVIRINEEGANSQSRKLIQVG